MWKKKPVLVATLCTEMEMLRQAIEVQTGERTTFVCLDFNTQKGQVRVGNKVFTLGFAGGREDLIDFSLNETLYVATFKYEDGNIRVSEEWKPRVRPTIAGEMTMRWVGTSLADRREEPLYLKEAEYCAQARGMTLDELMNSKP